MKKTVLHAMHAAAGARMAPFGGWDMPIQYAGILEEHRHTRSRVSVFDTCHMGEFEVSGPAAVEGLETLLTANIRDLRPGRCRYGYLLNEQGGVLDDLTCYHRGDDRYWLVVNAGTADSDFAWIAAHLPAGAVLEDRSDATAKLDVQGPESRTVLENLFGRPLPDIGYFAATEWTLRDVPVYLSRTGYTGEWGYEIYLPAERAPEMWERLTADGRIRPAGLGARDTLRLEMGYPLYGHELTADRSPVAASRGAFIDRGKSFIGQSRVERDLRDGCSRYLCGLRISSRRAARHGDPVCADGREIGRVTSGSFSPSLECAVAMAYLDRAAAEPGTACSVETRGKRLDAEVVRTPFYENGTARGV